MTERWTISEEEYDQRVGEAREAGERAYELKSRRPCWGLFSYGDAPGGMAGSGVGIFQWFETKTAMLEYVGHHLTFSSAGPSDVDPGRVADEARTLVETVGPESNPEVLEATRLELNKILRDFSQVEWWGSFEDLLQGNHPYAKEVRVWFRDRSDKEEKAADRPIGESEVADFQAAIEEYGL